MVAFSPLLVTLLSAASVWASPTPSIVSVQHPPFDPRSILCRIPFFQRICPRKGSTAIQVPTTIGTAQGTSTTSGAYRFAVRYATASRWAESVVAKTWDLPNGSKDPNALPLACPQPNIDASEFSEDCLSMVLYAPASILTSRAAAPVMVWIHGGSFVAGSATGPGLDGSSLAIATGAIVAVIQPRLGALGFMSPSGSTNLAVRDVMTSLKFLQQVIPSFGGHSGKITLAGQSSGANMIRALLAVPSASSLFQSAILQSDPMDFGFLSPTTQQSLQSYFNTQIQCSPSDNACLGALSTSDIIDAQNSLFNTAFTFAPSAGQFEPIRPVHDGTFITSPLDSTAPFPSVSKPILVTTVATEAGLSIYGNFPSFITLKTSPDYDTIVGATFGEPRTAAVLASPFYQVTGIQDARPALQTMGTDYIWRCSSWTLARSWVKNGGKAFSGLYVVGATYPGNQAAPFCTQAGSVCHQDDIQIVFGTVPNPTPAQAALVKEMQQRYKAFFANGDPNVPGLPQWQPATTTDVHSQLLGGTGTAAVGACDVDFWGSSVQYDYQFFGI